jgi:hypothetical protein
MSFFRHSSPEAYALIGGGGVIASLARVDWGAVLAAVCLAATMLGGAAMELYRRWRLTEIEIELAQRKARDPDTGGLRPDDRPDRQAGGLRPNSRLS